jgi:hypothetical protein
MMMMMMTGTDDDERRLGRNARRVMKARIPNDNLVVLVLVVSLTRMRMVGGKGRDGPRRASGTPRNARNDAVVSAVPVGRMSSGSG